MSGTRTYGDGSIYQRTDGRWCASLELGSDGAGKRRRLVLYGQTRREVVSKVRRAQRRVDDGAPATDSRVTVAALLERWLEIGLPAAAVKQSTRDNYGCVVRRHLIPALGALRLDRLAASHVDALILQKQQQRLSESTVRLIHTVLRRALDYAVRDGLIRRNVAAQVDRPVVGRREAAVLSPADAQELLDAARGDRLFALYAVAIAAGLRRGEALALRWSDVDLEAGSLRVARTLSRHSGGLTFTSPKSGRARRTVPLPEALVKELQAHRVRQAAERLQLRGSWVDHDLVFPSHFGTPLDPRNALRSFGQLVERVNTTREATGREALPKSGLHTLRHTCASLLLAQGVHPRVVMETLGHSGISITMDTYSHVMPEQQREAAQRMQAALRW